MLDEGYKPVTSGGSPGVMARGHGLSVTEARFGVINSALHSHERALLSVTVQGGWSQAFPARRYENLPGSVMFKPAGCRHRDIFERAGVRLVLVEIDETRVAGLTEQGIDFSAPRSARGPEVSWIGPRMVAELERDDRLTPLGLEGLVFELLVGLGRERLAGPVERDPVWIGRAREWLEAHWRETVTLADVAAAVNVSPVRLARGFRRTVGCSVGGYLRTMRLRWVADQVIGTEVPLAQLAREAGFADQSHLNRSFRRLFGTTPGRYRIEGRSERLGGSRPFRSRVVRDVQDGEGPLS